MRDVWQVNLVLNDFPMGFFIALGGLGVFLIGVSKTGFGGGGGNLAAPLMAMVISARESVGILLPVLCIADLVSLWFYRGKWNYKVIKILIPGSVIGIILGSFLLGSISDAYLKRIIGLIAIGFVVIQFLRYEIRRSTKAYVPKNWHGIIFGGAAGTVSTLTHSAGPVLQIFLLPMSFSKQTFVATTVIYFAMVNYVKLIPYTILGIFDYNLVSYSIILLPFVILGTYAGFRLNRIISSERFTLIIYLLLLFTGIQLVTGLNLMEIVLESI